MAEDTGATGTQAEPETQPPAGTPPTQADGGKGDQAQPETMSLEEAKKLRQEHNALRKRIAEFEKAQKDADEAALPEKQRLEKQVSDLAAEKADLARQLQETRVRESVIGAASKLGFTDPLDAYARLMLTPSALEYDDDGKAKNVDPLLVDILAKSPHLGSGRRQQGSPDAGFRGTPAAKSDDFNSLIRAARGH